MNDLQYLAEVLKKYYDWLMEAYSDTKAPKFLHESHGVLGSLYFVEYLIQYPGEDMPCTGLDRDTVEITLNIFNPETLESRRAEHE